MRMIGVSLKKKKEMSMQCFEEELQPEDVYFPITKEDKILVKTGDVVKEGDILGRYTKYDMPILASIGGTVSITPDLSYIHIKNNGDITSFSKK